MLDLITARKDTLYHYSPVSFFPRADKEKIYQHSIIKDLERLISDKDVESIRVNIDGYEHIFIVKFLKWDTDYFGKATFRLLYILYAHKCYNILKSATNIFVKDFFKEKGLYCFCEIPSEDIFTIQALNESGFKLVENRLTYYLNLKNYAYTERYKVRSATLNDIPNLKRVAREMRNDFDRFHAETVFDLIKADEFLATYIEESVNGYSDYTMVPAELGVPSDAFLTANYLYNEWDSIGEKVSKMVLSAVSETCKGWYLKLISEMAFHLKTKGADYAFMHPATTNRAVIHTYEKLGCKYGKCVHILTYTT